MNAIRTKMGNNGRVVIPAAYRKALGIEDGDDVIMQLQDGELRLMSRAAAIKHAQELVRHYVPAGHSLVDDLMTERRGEAARE